MAASSCEECGSDRRRPSALPGMVVCLDCGKLFAGETAPSEPQLAVSESDQLVVPDLIQAVEGWRAWHLTMHGKTPLLNSATWREHYWQPRMTMHAICGQGRDHSVPFGGCRCGLYAAKTQDQLLTMGYPNYDGDAFVVLGRVKFWGTVIEGTQGWRATSGYPAELFVPFEAWRYADAVEETYGVPVGLRNWLGDSFELPKEA